MKNKKLVYLISTNSDCISSLLDRVVQEISVKSNVEVVISTQSKSRIEKGCNIDGLTIIRCSRNGLSANRNFALDYFRNNFTDSYAIITDDDVKFNRELEYDLVEKIFTSNSADVVTGRIKVSSNTYYKKYKSEVFLHNQRSINSVSSIEIIIKSGIDFPSFDEMFGLGAKYKMGEEAIFLGDCLRMSFKLIFYPINLFYHPIESTGKIIDEKWYIAKGAFYKRRYGFWIGLPLLIRTIFKMRSGMSMSSYLQVSKGFFFNVKKSIN